MRVPLSVKRAAFLFLFVGLALVACTAGSQSSGQNSGNSSTQIPSTVAGLAAPLMGKVSDNLPVYTCAADAFASYYTLQVIQQAGLDVAHGFHLAIFPFALNDSYNINEDQRVQALAAGQWDC